MGITDRPWISNYLCFSFEGMHWKIQTLRCCHFKDLFTCKVFAWLNSVGTNCFDTTCSGLFWPDLSLYLRLYSTRHFALWFATIDLRHFDKTRDMTWVCIDWLNLHLNLLTSYETVLYCRVRQECAKYLSMTGVLPQRCRSGQSGLASVYLCHRHYVWTTYSNLAHNLSVIVSSHSLCSLVGQ